jgi:hypothetical protein
MRVFCNSEPARVVPWSTADYFEVEAEVNELLAQCGLPPRPGGRIWLFKPPPDQPSVDDTLSLLVESAGAAGVDEMASAPFVDHVRTTLPTFFRGRT